jgi:large subunit ribosomal protein L30
MGQIKITQVKSVIDRSKRQKATIEALGLRKINHTVTKDVNPQIMGMVAKVRHLVTVEEC